MATVLRQLRLVRPYISITLLLIVHMGTVSKAVPGWVCVLAIVGCGMFLPRNILPLEDRRRLTET